MTDLGPLVRNPLNKQQRSRHDRCGVASVSSAEVIDAGKGSGRLLGKRRSASLTFWIKSGRLSIVVLGVLWHPHVAERM